MPVQLLSSLAAPSAADAVRAAIEADRAVRSAAATFGRAAWPRLLAKANASLPRRDTAFKRIYRMRRGVSRLQRFSNEDEQAWREVLGAADPQLEWPEQWRTLLDERDGLARAARGEHASAILAGRMALRQVYANSDVQHAVFLSNPGFYGAGLAHWLGRPQSHQARSEERQTELTAHRYLRRFCAKCETTSFFGPILFAEVDPTCDDAFAVGDPAGERVIVGASAWAVEAIASAVRERLPAEQLVCRRNPLYLEVEGGLLRVIDQRLTAVPETALDLWRALDGVRPLAAVAEGIAAAASELRALMLLLAPFVVIGPEVAATELRPLETLAAADASDGPAVQLAVLANSFASAPWPERRAIFEEAEHLVERLGEAPRRGSGRHFGDRTVFHEDRAAALNARVWLGGKAADRILRAVADVAPICFVGALLRREDARDVVRAILGGKEAPLASLARCEIPATGNRLARFEECLAELASGGDHLAAGVRLDGGALDSLLTEFLTEIQFAPDEVAACLPSFDLHAAGRHLADADWVVGEIHDDASTIYGGFTAAAHPDAAACWSDFVNLVRPAIDFNRMATIVSRRRTKHVTPELPGLSIELSGRSMKPRAGTAPIAEVNVSADARFVRYRGRNLQLYPGDLSSPLHLALSLPALKPVEIDLGAVTPRIVVGDTVYQRARWRVEIGRTAESYEGWRRFHEVAIESALPRHVFLHHPLEPKPLYVDLADTLAVADVLRLPPAAALVVEALPAPDELWWQPSGDHQYAEVRLGAVLTFGGSR
jgi:hypothetical protein